MTRARGKAEQAALFIADGFPFSACRRCQHHRPADSEGRAWCWLRDGIGAEQRESECPAFIARQRAKGKR